MKHFFTSACAKIGRFFWSWGFLKFCLWAVTLVILFYVEEDWRGARAWAATKAEWEAKGESFDFNKFIPPPVPDDQNLAAIPLFKLEPGKAYQGKPDLEPVAFYRALRRDLPGQDLPWAVGWTPDMTKIRLAIATNYSAAFKGAPPPGDTLAQFDALYPFLSDLRAAAATRPLCRFDSDYATVPFFNRSLGLLTQQLGLSFILRTHAIIALDQHQPDLALEDLKINYKLLSADKRDPSLVGGLVAIGMNAISEVPLYDGLTLHAWNDAQLAELEQTYEQINFLADYQFAMRSEATHYIVSIDYLKKGARLSEYDELMSTLNNTPTPGIMTRMLRRTPVLWPGGWWDDIGSQLTACLLNALAAVDPQARRVFPEVDLDLQHQFQTAQARWDAMAPWNIWYTLETGLITHAIKKYAYAQGRVDEARIACALERYRLAHNAYPDSLDALVPACIDELPHDIVNGEPYHYHLRPDGTFLLYSLGLNQIDNGGRITYVAGTTSIDHENGNWVWPAPLSAP